MIYRSSIYTIPEGEEPVWKEGVPSFGWVKISNRPIPPDESSPISRQVIHCAPGTEPPENVVAVGCRGNITPWTPEQICAAWPNGHLYVMEATWLAEIGGSMETIRGKMIDIPPGVSPIETLLVPHEWLGDGETS